AAEEEESAFGGGVAIALFRARGRIGRDAAARRRGLARAIAGFALVVRAAGGVAQNGARLVLHRAAVARRAQPQAPLQIVVELADGDAGHGRTLAASLAYDCNAINAITPPNSKRVFGRCSVPIRIKKRGLLLPPG